MYRPLFYNVYESDSNAPTPLDSALCRWDSKYLIVKDLFSSPT